MFEDKIGGLLLAIPALIFIYILLQIDKHYLNSRLSNLFSNPTFRIMFMVLLFVTIMLSAIHWRAYTTS